MKKSHGNEPSANINQNVTAISDEYVINYLLITMVISVLLKQSVGSN